MRVIQYEVSDPAARDEIGALIGEINRILK
jgi:HAMP domain-containing protein